MVDAKGIVFAGNNYSCAPLSAVRSDAPRVEIARFPPHIARIPSSTLRAPTARACGRPKSNRLKTCSTIFPTVRKDNTVTSWI